MLRCKVERAQPGRDDHLSDLLTALRQSAGDPSPVEYRMFWKPISHEEAARLKSRYNELGSLQAVAEEVNMHTGRLGRALAMHDRRVAGSDADYTGPERRRK